MKGKYHVTIRSLNNNWYDEEGRLQEPLLANPDGLLEEDNPWKFIHSPKHQKLKDQLQLAIKAMTGKKHDVWILLWQGKSLGEISTLLQISKGSVQTYYKRGIKEIRKLCT